jgi:hypothetical protein
MVTKTQDRRRSQRVLLKMRVEVSGSREGRSFSENAETGATEISVEFESPSPRFWHIAFPPEDWTPKSPEAKRFEAQRLRTHSV